MSAWHALLEVQKTAATVAVNSAQSASRMKLTV